MPTREGCPILLERASDRFCNIKIGKLPSDEGHGAARLLRRLSPPCEGGAKGGWGRTPPAPGQKSAPEPSCVPARSRRLPRRANRHAQLFERCLEPFPWHPFGGQSGRWRVEPEVEKVHCFFVVATPAGGAATWRRRRPAGRIRRPSPSASIHARHGWRARPRWPRTSLPIAEANQVVEPDQEHGRQEVAPEIQSASLVDRRHDPDVVPEVPLPQVARTPRSPAPATDTSPSCRPSTPAAAAIVVSPVRA